jgi:hypothetical protein
MKARILILLVLAALVILGELRCTPQLGGRWEGVPYQTMGSPDAWTVDVATGERGRDGWWTFRLYGEGGDLLATVNRAIDAQAWMEFETNVPRLDWWARYGIVGAVTNAAPAE